MKFPFVLRSTYNELLTELDEQERLRQRTHDISESMSMENGAITRQNSRYRRALIRAMCLVGANMAAANDENLVPSGAVIVEDGDGNYGPRPSTFREDIRFIHGLAPELTFATDFGYEKWMRSRDGVVY